MPFNFYDTHTLLMAVQQLTPAATFLRDRYFPTNDASDIFATDDVLVEFRDGSKKLAPFVAPRKGGVTVLRAGYNMERYTPPFVAPRRVLTLDELRKRGFGEALYSQLTPEQRQQTLILRDADELGELITNREEAMAAETMLTNGCVMKHIADDVDKADEMEIRFYSEASNPATYTPTAKWDATGGKILKDLEAMIRMLTKRGLRASDLVCSPDVADTIINDAAVQKLLDNRRIEIGNVEPELLPDGAAIVARLNVLGRIISVISYDLTYTDDEGNDKEYKILNVTLVNKNITMLTNTNLTDDQRELYGIYLESKGNRDYLFADDIYSNPAAPPSYTIPGEALNDATFRRLITEAEKYLGYPYVWGGSSPSTSFDCSGFVCWVYQASGVYPLSRTTAQGIFNQCAVVSRADAKPGDIIFFTGTYNAGEPVTHVGIFVGNGMMIHCGNPIQYASIDSSYWSSHFYAFGRLGGG